MMIRAVAASWLPTDLLTVPTGLIGPFISPSNLQEKKNPHHGLSQIGNMSVNTMNPR